MNRFISALILLFLSFGISISGYFYILDSADELIKMIDEDRQLILESGTASAERAEKIQELWKEKETILVAVLPHGELDEIEMNIKKLSHFQNQNFTEEYLKALNDCTSRLEHVCESEKPDFKNVF